METKHSPFVMICLSHLLGICPESLRYKLGLKEVIRDLEDGGLVSRNERALGAHPRDQCERDHCLRIQGYPLVLHRRVAILAL